MNEFPRTSIKKVLIYGYGVMGEAVAKTFVKSGFEVNVFSSRANELADSEKDLIFHKTFFVVI